MSLPPFLAYPLPCFPTRLAPALVRFKRHVLAAGQQHEVPWLAIESVSVHMVNVCVLAVVGLGPEIARRDGVPNWAGPWGFRDSAINATVAHLPGQGRQPPERATPRGERLWAIREPSPTRQATAARPQRAKTPCGSPRSAKPRLDGVTGRLGACGRNPANPPGGRNCPESDQLGAMDAGRTGDGR